MTVLGAVSVPVYLELGRLEDFEELIERRREILAKREQMWREQENHRTYLNQVIEQNRMKINVANKSVGTFIQDTTDRKQMLGAAQEALRSLWHCQQTLKDETEPERVRRSGAEWERLSKQFALFGDDARVAAKRQNRALQELVPRMAQSRETMLAVIRQQNILMEEQDRVWRTLQDQEVGYLQRLQAELALLDGFEKKLVSIMPLVPTQPR